MTTAIAVYDSDGLVGRCDARCHEAREPECDCICGGRLHGVADRVERDRIMRDELLPHELRDELERFAERHGSDAAELSVVAPVPLFGGEDAA